MVKHLSLLLCIVGLLSCDCCVTSSVCIALRKPLEPPFLTRASSGLFGRFGGQSRRSRHADAHPKTLLQRTLRTREPRASIRRGFSGRLSSSSARARGAPRELIRLGGEANVELLFAEPGLSTFIREASSSAKERSSGVFWSSRSLSGASIRARRTLVAHGSGRGAPRRALAGLPLRHSGRIPLRTASADRESRPRGGCSPRYHRRPGDRTSRPRREDITELSGDASVDAEGMLIKAGSGLVGPFAVVLAVGSALAVGLKLRAGADTQDSGGEAALGGAEVLVKRGHRRSKSSKGRAVWVRNPSDPTITEKVRKRLKMRGRSNVEASSPRPLDHAPRLPRAPPLNPRSGSAMPEGFAYGDVVMDRRAHDRADPLEE